MKKFFFNVLKYLLAIGIFTGSITLGGYILDYKLELKQVQTTTSTMATTFSSTAKE